MTVKGLANGKTQMKAKTRGVRFEKCCAIFLIFCKRAFVFLLTGLAFDLYRGDGGVNEMGQCINEMQ